MTKAERAMIPPRSADCQPAAFGSLPNAPLHHSSPIGTNCSRQAAADYRLAACAPQNFA
jgi:hypothetical protein